MRKSAGGALTIALLRPIEWIEDHAAQPGSTVHLDLHEMGAVGDATVIAINDCPPIEPGVGTVVTGKFVHQCAPGTKLVHLRIEGQSEPTGVTDSHPYWSVDRHHFIPAGELQIGELVDTEFGSKRVDSVTFWTGFDGLLYNLETTEHVFRVGSVGSLVHNAYAGAAETIHKNSRAYQGKSHVYVITAPDGSIHKVGKSSMGTRLSDGASKRAEAQVRRLNRTDIANGGSGGFGSDIRKDNLRSTGAALDFERRWKDTFRRLYGRDKLPGNLR